MKSSPLGYIKTKLSQFENDELFITKDVQNLTHYYTRNETHDKAYIEGELAKKVANEALNDYMLKSGTYDRATIEQKIANVTTGLSIQVITDLGSITDDRTIYLYAKQDSSENDVYDEYMLIEGKPELIGTTAIDLAAYMTRAEMERDYAKDANLATVAKTGNYNDLFDTPTIPTEVGQLIGQKNLVRKQTLQDELNKRGNVQLKREFNKSIAVEDWQAIPGALEGADQFKADVPVAGVTADKWKVTDYYTPALYTGELSATVTVGEGVVTFYAKVKPQSPIVIENMDIMAAVDPVTIV